MSKSSDVSGVVVVDNCSTTTSDKKTMDNNDVCTKGHKKTTWFQKHFNSWSCHPGFKQPKKGR